jgi:hypothetical protein
MNGSKKMGTSVFVPVYILLPRNDTLKHSPSSNQDVVSLRNILQSNNKIKTRGDKRSGFSMAYATLGVTACQGRTGFSWKHPVSYEDLLHINSMVKRMDFFAKMWMPFGLLTILNELKKQSNDEKTLLGDGVGKRTVWASCATSFNYISPAHIDQDSFLSIMTVSFVPKNHPVENKYSYIMDMPVAVYFCIPVRNLAIALRPGDVIIFNPLEYHCISQRTEHYRTEEVFITSFYFKTMQIGLNDNSIPHENKQTIMKPNDAISQKKNVDISIDNLCIN